MMGEYEKLAKDIFAACGGEKNISMVSHCATRLRVTLNKIKGIELPKMESIPGVMGVINRNNDYQFVIGTDVNKVYGEFITLGKFKKEGKVDEAGNKNIGGKIIDFISGTFVPMLPILVAAGLVSALLTIAASFFGMSADSGTYIILSAINSAGFYFIPVYLGYSAAGKLGINPFMGCYLACILIYDTINGAAGLDFFGIPVTQVTYGQSVIPIILGVLFMALVDKLFDRIPKEIKFFAKPLLVIILTTPVVLILLGPIGTWISNGLGYVIDFIYRYFGAFAVAILGALSPILVMTGTNQALFPPCLTALAEFGYDPFILPAMLAANTAVGASALAVWLKSKNKDIKATGISTGLTGVLGITEPAIYGVLLRFKKPFLGAIAGGAVGGLFAGLLKVKQYALVSPGIAALPTFIAPDGSMRDFWLAIVTIIISCAVSFAVTWLLGFEDPIEEDQELIK